MADDHYLDELPLPAPGSAGWGSITDGWPDPMRTDHDYYDIAGAALIEYFIALRPALAVEQIHELVVDSITEFAAAWHRDAANRRSNSDASAGPSPADLAAAVHDDFLDLLFDPDRRRRTAAPRPSERDDERLAALAFGTTPDLVRAGMAELRSEGRPRDFQVITQYLDLVDANPTAPPRTAQVIRRIGDEGTGEAVARAAIVAFHHRLARARHERG